MAPIQKCMGAKSHRLISYDSHPMGELVRSDHLISLETKEKKAEKTVSGRSDAPKSTGWLVLTKKSKMRTGRKGKRGKNGRAPSLPPTLEAVIVCHHVFRFQVTTGFTALVNITGGNLAGITGGLCSTVNSVVTCPASSMRIHRITIWPPQQSAPTNPPEVTWFSPITIMERDESKESMLPAGISVDRALVSRPPKGTICADWFSTVGGANQAMFGLTNMAAGGVIDVDVSWTISNNLLGVDRSVSTAVIKTWYYLYLDGSSSHQLTPVGKPSTF